MELISLGYDDPVRFIMEKETFSWIIYLTTISIPAIPQMGMIK